MLGVLLTVLHLLRCPAFHGVLAGIAYFTVAPQCPGRGGQCPGQFDVQAHEDQTKPMLYICRRKSVALSVLLSACMRVLIIVR